MSLNIIHKEVQLFGLTIHQSFFKQVKNHEFEDICNAVSDYLYEQRASIVSFCIINGNSKLKPIQKTLINVFDEVNWPIQFVIADDDVCSGVFLSVANCNVKTILANNIISKILETNSGKFALFGSENPAQKLTIEQLETPLMFAGLSPKHVLHQFEISELNNEVGQKLVFASNCVKTKEIAQAGTIIGNILYTDKQQVISLTSHSKLIEAVQISEFIHDISKTIEAHNFTWQHLIHAKIVCKSKEFVKELKQVFKQNKIPLSVALMYVQSNNAPKAAIKINMTCTNGSESET